MTNGGKGEERESEKTGAMLWKGYLLERSLDLLDGGHAQIPQISHALWPPSLVRFNLSFDSRLPIHSFLA